MEDFFGADFGDVSVHTDARAAGLARELGAEAFTLGDHVYFGEEKFDPSSTEGRGLLAHELTHVLQQKGLPRPRAQGSGSGIGPTALEGEAEGLRKAFLGTSTGFQGDGLAVENYRAAYMANRPMREIERARLERIAGLALQLCEQMLAGRPDVAAAAAKPIETLELDFPLSLVGQSDEDAARMWARRMIDAIVKAANVSATGAAPAAIQKQVSPPNATVPPTPASVVSVRVRVATGPDPEYTSNSRNSGSGVVVFSANPEETYASFRQLGAGDMWNMACVVGNLSQWAATAPDSPPESSPGGGIQATNPDPKDTAFDEKYRATLPHFKKHVQAFYKSFKEFQEDFKQRGTKATLGMIEESRARTRKVIDDLGIAPVTESERGPLGAEYTTTYRSKSDKIKQLSAAATKLAVKQEALNKLLQQDKDRHGFLHWATTSKEELEKEDKELKEKIPEARKAFEAEQSEALGKFPILSRFETAEQLKMLSNEAQTAHYVGAKLYETLENLKELEEKLKANSSRILTLPEHLERLKDALKLGDFERRTVTYMAQKYTGDIETGQRVAVLIAVVLAAIAAAPTGGGSVVFLAAALGEAGINTMLLLQAYDQYSLEKAAAGSDPDKTKALASDDPSFLWLAAQVVTTLAGLKGSAGTVMSELKIAFQEIKAGYKVAAATGETGALKNALKARGIPEDSPMAKDLLARAAKESLAILEGIAKGGPEGLQAALEMLKTSPSFYGVRLAVWRLKAGANEGVVKQNLQAARQQIINQIVNDMKRKYPKASFAVADAGFEKPLIVKIGSSEPVPAHPSASQASSPPSSSAASAASGPDSLPPDVKGTPVVPPPSGLLVAAGRGPSGGKPITPGVWNFPQPGSAPASPLGPSSAPRLPVNPQAASVPPPGGAFHPPMAVPEGVSQALNAADDIRAASQPALGGASAAAGVDASVEMDAAVAPFGPMGTSMREYYDLRPRIPRPEYNGLYMTLDDKFSVHQEMTSRFTGKGSSGKIILQTASSDPSRPHLYMFKPARGENVRVGEYYLVAPGTFFVRGRAAYDLAMSLPTLQESIVPMSVVVYNGQVGSMQPLIKNTENLLDLAEGKAINPALSSDQAKQLHREIWETNPQFAKFRENLRAYDHVINNPDRNIGNYLVELNDDLTVKRFYAIDQDLALKPGARNVLYKDREAIPRFSSPIGPQVPTGPQAHLGKISRSLYDEFVLMKVNEASVRESLQVMYGVDRATADGIFSRLDEIIRDYENRLQTMNPADVFSSD